MVKAEPQLYQVIYIQHLDVPTSKELLPALPNPKVAPSLTPPALS
jgi:hypothetical protein